jgi:hypothetical protein
VSYITTVIERGPTTRLVVATGLGGAHQNLRKIGEMPDERERVR